LLRKGGERLHNTTATFADRLLEKACNENASDIHFYPLTEKGQINIYFRLLGNRTYIKTINTDLYQVLLTYFKFSSNMDIAEIRRPQNGTLSFQSKQKKKYSLRLSTLPMAQTESLTIRILPQDALPSTDQLFLFPAQFKTMKQWLKQDSGIILLTGPTGCGKSTTMYSLLESMLNERSFQAITLEDPVERQLDHVIQVEVNERAGITYQSGLKAALRHDPDVILIGEIRDSETAAFAFEAALTGHLVLSTLHAKDAPGTIERLLDLGINRVDIMQTLIAVASIQLVPVTQDNHESKRAAIVELLDGLLLQNMIEGNHQNKGLNYQSFQQLKEKAYLYGFISKEVYEGSY